MAKRPKDIQNVVDSVNRHLEWFKVSDENNALFGWIQMYLLEKKSYMGFNYYCYNDEGHTILCGRENALFIQMY